MACKHQLSTVITPMQLETPAAAQPRWPPPATVLLTSESFIACLGRAGPAGTGLRVCCRGLYRAYYCRHVQAASITSISLLGLTECLGIVSKIN